MCVWWLIRPSTGRNKHNHCCPPLCREQLITNGSVSVHTITTCFQHALINIIGESCHKHPFFFVDKSLVVTNTCLWRQNTSFVATKVCLCDKTFVLFAYFCRNATKRLLSRQTRVCRDKNILWRQT